MFTDCDGTLLQPDHTISPAAERMLERLDEAGVRVVPATGRARAGAWTEAVLNRLPALHRGAPGVFLNGRAAFSEEVSCRAAGVPRSLRPSMVLCARSRPFPSWTSGRTWCVGEVSVRSLAWWCNVEMTY